MIIQVVKTSKWYYNNYLHVHAEALPLVKCTLQVVLSSNLNVAVHPLWFWFGITWYIKGSQQGVPALGVAEEYLDDDCLVNTTPGSKLEGYIFLHYTICTG